MLRLRCATVWAIMAFYALLFPDETIEMWRLGTDDMEQHPFPRIFCFSVFLIMVPYSLICPRRSEIIIRTANKRKIEQGFKLTKVTKCDLQL